MSLRRHDGEERLCVPASLVLRHPFESRRVIHILALVQDLILPIVEDLQAQTLLTCLVVSYQKKSLIGWRFFDPLVLTLMTLTFAPSEQVVLLLAEVFQWSKARTVALVEVVAPSTFQKFAVWALDPHHHSLIALQQLLLEPQPLLVYHASF